MKKILITLFALTLLSSLSLFGDEKPYKGYSNKYVDYKNDTSAFISPAIADAAQRGKKLKKFAFGGNVNINFDNAWTKYKDSGSGFQPTGNNGLFQIVIKPKFCWFINEKMQAGGRVGVSYGHFDMGMKEHPETSVLRAAGWNLNPYYSYRLIQWRRLGIWLEANALVGQYYNTQKDYDAKKEWGMMTEYGVQVLPSLDIYLAEGFSLELHFGILSLGWYGTSSKYEDRTEVTSSWDIRKGGLDGLLYGFSNYGIGLVRRF